MTDLDKWCPECNTFMVFLGIYDCPNHAQDTPCAEGEETRWECARCGYTLVETDGDCQAAPEDADNDA
jgi:ribosomal protein S27AE